jgi:tRNA A-37 threonylcarbamoyl transferase component Bud32
MMETRAQNDSAEATKDWTAPLKVFSAGVYVWRTTKEFSGNEGWLSHPERIVEDDTNLLKKPIPGSGTRVGRTAASTGSFVVKEYRAPGVREICNAVIRRPRAVRTFEMLSRLQRLGIAAIRPVAAAHERGKPWHSMLVTEELTHSERLYDYAARSRGHRSKTIAPLARIFAALHNAGFLHRDAHHANFVVKGQNAPELYLVDVDGVREARNITLRHAARDISRLLVHLDIPKQERLRFALIYCRERNQPVPTRQFVSLFGP